MTRHLPTWLRHPTATELLDRQLADARTSLLEASARREWYAAVEQMLQNRIVRLVKLQAQGDVR